MLAGEQLLLAKLLAFLCANQLVVTDIVKHDITMHLSEKTLMPFAMTYLCESGFSALTSMKTSMNIYIYIYKYEWWGGYIAGD